MLADRVRMSSGGKVDVYGDPYLYKEGLFGDEWVVFTFDGKYTLTLMPDHIDFVINNNIAQGGWSALNSKNKLDVTPFTKLHLDCSITISGAYNSASITLGLTDTQSTGAGLTHIASPQGSNILRTTYSLDINNINGLKYVVVGFRKIQGIATFEVYNIWFE